MCQLQKFSIIMRYLEKIFHYNRVSAIFFHYNKIFGKFFPVKSCFITDI